jgi:cysteine synthase A
VIFTEPAGAPMVTKGEFVPHKIQGWTPDFVPAVFDRKVFDEAVLVTDIEARDTARDWPRRKGSSAASPGGTLAAALKVAEKAPEGSVLLAMLPDTGERYLSTILFEGITDESDEPSLGL